MHNKPHTEAAKAKMRAARRKQPRKWGWLPENEILFRLLHTAATRRSIASEYGCSETTINNIFRKGANTKERLAAKHRKQAASLRGRPNPQFADWRRRHPEHRWSGRKHTAAAKRKQSAAKKGKPQSLARRIRQSARMQGIAVAAWRGFASSKAEGLKRSLAWRKWRETVFERDNWTCQHCRARGRELHPHHIHPKSTHPEEMFDPDNGITLCVPCHRATSSYGFKPCYAT